MIVWRISNHATLDGGGGLVVAGRWHSKGRRIVYCADTPAAAMLELLVHAELDPEDVPSTYQLLQIHIPDDLAAKRMNPTELPGDWRNDERVTRQLGDAWLEAQEFVLLRVPSAIVPESANDLINPLHPDAARIEVLSVGTHPLDPRLLRRA